jgi:indole-3-glycerol phosphate synthase
MNILDQIVAAKHKEVADKKELFPVKLLEKSVYFPTKPVSLKKYLTKSDKSGIISEIKRKSPSRGIINSYVSIERTSIGYMQAGASALSILTDKQFFGGSSEDLSKARKFNFCPILRKDFIVDEYQLFESKSIGADAVLLIAAVLQPAQIRSLAKTAKSLQLEVLMEVHNRQELEENLWDEIDCIGVNNRNLKTFEVNIETSMEMADFIPSDKIKVAESGINNPEAIIKLKKAGFQGFLIGEYFMKNSRPEKACQEFIQDLRKLQGKDLVL